MVMKFLEKVAPILASIGALNWGATVFGVNFVDMIVGKIKYVPEGIYLGVGVSGVYLIYKMFK